MVIGKHRCLIWSSSTVHVSFVQQHPSCFPSDDDNPVSSDDDDARRRRIIKVPRRQRRCGNQTVNDEYIRTNTDVFIVCRHSLTTACADSPPHPPASTNGDNSNEDDTIW
ncbi:uncharacterized protein LACBIDRAFT_298233 [Laccaria bicolor S238N-H82]|uniref:Predicted protein n=1 Tax=Laccaria bicolor (strain S238N-H82 / ATCC MYA-4686) TaxID=486041 RepID=B0DCI6_LACBS|nr:uncharacterized protein LACBIDRAFT_298233 [Laccaria bicolor S238N-H82]EDR07905.1 predicted protein [Laccaria bicolor S238N-H82]|eukprot:XP_001881694.1 predicted protein [Laccaria bicolor S238N-H82]